MNDSGNQPIFVATANDFEKIVRQAVNEAIPRPLFYEAKDEVEDEKFLSRVEVARMLGVNVSTLWRWAKDNSLPCVHIGRSVRYKLTTVRKYMELHEGR